MRHLLSLAACACLLSACATEEDDGLDGFLFRGDEQVGADKCTRTLGYWKTHNKYAAKAHKRLPWPVPNAEDVVACGETLLDWLWTPPQGDSDVILGHQYIAARLNQAAGAPVPPEVGQAMVAGAAYLNTCDIDDEDRADALEYSEILDAYNNGELGVPHCD